jgi:hypothetical protein
MIKKIFCLLPCLLLFKSYLYAYNKDFDSDSLGNRPSFAKLEKSKYIPAVKKDTLHYTLPFLTIHLGASVGLSNGVARINSESSAGTRVNFKNDLGFPSSTFFPRVNIVLATSQRMQFIFDINNINIRKTAIISKDLRIGNLELPSNTSIRSNFNLFFTNLSYRSSFVSKKHFNFGGLLGLDLHQYILKINNNATGESDKTSFYVWTPLVGLDIYGFLHKDFFFRGTLNYTALPFHNYDLTQLSFKSYIEYYFIKNFGLGFSYNYFYSDVRQFSKINGSLKYQIHSISLFASFRLY